MIRPSLSKTPFSPIVRYPSSETEEKADRPRQPLRAGGEAQVGEGRETRGSLVAAGLEETGKEQEQEAEHH
jgi:hypothetical protein